MRISDWSSDVCSSELATNAANAAVIIDLLAIVRLISDRRRAYEIQTLPAVTPEIEVVPGTRAVEVTGPAKVPELTPAVLISLSAVEQELSEQFDRFGDRKSTRLNSSH